MMPQKRRQATESRRSTNPDQTPRQANGDDSGAPDDSQASIKLLRAQFCQLVLECLVGPHKQARLRAFQRVAAEKFGGVFGDVPAPVLNEINRRLSDMSKTDRRDMIDERTPEEWIEAHRQGAEDVAS